ncbi:MAG TPA: DUF302 domain-containing protein [candidate division Zixibacteria bacterium]|nr:DUF302 domain-containing protein [candidate division Zixibacteria bacterium]
MTDTSTVYAFRARVDLPYGVGVEKVTAVLREEGFGILTEIDVRATLKNKLDTDFRKYTILGACNPSLAYEALNNELEIGLLLPCNVIVYKDDSQKGSVVSIVDPITMLGVATNPNLDSVASEARIRLLRVLATLGK